MKVTLDGPAGSGKSTLARRLAGLLGFDFLDSGALYRAAARLALDSGIDPADGPGIARLLAKSRVAFEGAPEGARVWVGGREITKELRSPEVTGIVSLVARHPEVREALVPWMRDVGRSASLVAEGRDMGSVVFPEAEVKVYLTASLSERAERRRKELSAMGFDRKREDLETEIASRDRADATREFAPLVRPEGAIDVDTTGRSIEGVLETLSLLVRERLALGGGSR